GRADLWRVRDRPEDRSGGRPPSVRDRRAGGLRRDRAAGPALPGADQRRREITRELVRGSRRRAGRCVAGAAGARREWASANVSEFVGWVKPTDSLGGLNRPTEDPASTTGRVKVREALRESVHHQGDSPRQERRNDEGQHSERSATNRAGNGRGPE